MPCVTKHHIGLHEGTHCFKTLHCIAHTYNKQPKAHTHIHTLLTIYIYYIYMYIYIYAHTCAYTVAALPKNKEV